MFLLALCCLLDFGFVQLFKVSQRRGYAAPVVVPVNYLTIACVLQAYLTWKHEFELSAEIVLIGVLTGTAFIGSLLLMTWALEVVHVAVVMVGFRLAMIVPIVASLWLWDEQARTIQFVGLGIAGVGLWLVTGSDSSRGRIRGVRLIGIVLAVFLLQGASHTCMRWVKHAGLDDQQLNVLFVIAFTAGSVGSLRVFLSAVRPRWSEIAMGSGIGLFNLVALATILKTLAMFEAVIFFAVVGCAVVILDSLAAQFFWKERLRRRAWCGVALAVVAIVMVLGMGAADS